jgi:pimeloyl-ACP methyl ester carboxylesterase
MSANSLEHHSVHLNGIKQHYVKSGSGPAVMLLHGWPQTWYEWRHVIGLLGDKFTVVAPDLRGFGYSSKPTSGYDAATIAADLAATPARCRPWASWTWSCPAWASWNKRYHPHRAEIFFGTWAFSPFQICPNC